jgi:hypothetical protein
MRVSYVTAIALLSGAVVACAKGERDQASASGASQAQIPRLASLARNDSGAALARNGGPGSSLQSPVPLATRPPDGCGWIPAAEVEALIGRFAEPPRPRGNGCVYVLPISPEVAAMRERLAESNRKLGVTPERPWQGTPFGVVLQVGVGIAQGERGVRLMGGPLAASLKNDQSTSGWDAVRLNGGRLGTITVTASALTADVPVSRDSLRALTARVRDRITDLPFAAPAGGQKAESPDPCMLVTREEAESVLGKLVVAPYRSANGGPLADPNGASCAYHSAKHHVLVVRPFHSGGKKELAMTRVIGGALDAMVSDTEAAAADTIEGTWDETAMSRDGRLLLRKDDRAVELEYETSSTDKAGALKLGRIAIERLANGQR